MQSLQTDNNIIRARSHLMTTQSDAYQRKAEQAEKQAEKSKKPAAGRTYKDLAAQLRELGAFNRASCNGCPASRRTLANSTTKIPFFAASAISTIMPI
jgi:hypothetical protein